MAGEKKIVIDIDIKAEDITAAKDAMEKSAKSAANLTKELNDLKKEQKVLAATTSAAGKDTAEYAKKQADLKLKMTEVSKSLRESNKEYANNKTVVDAAKGSNEQLRARLSLLTKKYNGLSHEQRENSKEGKEQQATIKAITDKLKDNEKAVGDNRRNVGNYSEALEDMANQLNIGGVNIGGMITKLKTNKEALTAARQAQVASNVATSAGTKAMKLFKYALAATGIGALLVALGALVSYFTQTKRGSELIDQSMAAVGATVQVLVDRLSSLVHAFKLVFDGEFKGAADAMAASFSGIGDEIANDSKAAIELEKRMQKLRDAERALTVETANRKAEVAALQLIAEDETKTFQERGEAIAKANEIQKQQLETELNLQREKVAIIEQQMALGENLEEDEQRLAEERARLGEIEAASLKKLRTLKAKENSITNQAHAATVARSNELRKLTEDQIKAEEQAAEKRADIREGFRRDQLTDLERRKEDALSRATQLREAGEAEKEVQAFLSKELIEIKRAEQDVILNEKLQALEDYAEASRVAARTDIEDAELRNIALLEIEAELLAAKKQTLDLEAGAYSASLEEIGVIDEERNAQILEQKAELDAQIIENDTATTDAIIANLDRIAQKRADDQAAAFNGIAGTTSQALGAASMVVNAQISAIEEKAKAEGKSQEETDKLTKKSRDIAKGIAITQSIITTAQATLAAYTSALSVPIIGIGLAPIAAGVAAGFGAIQTGVIAAQKFEDGGVLKGASHADGGIQLHGNGHHYGEAEGDEIILTKGVYRDPSLRQQASALNVAGGGKPLTPSSYMASGGIVSPTFAARNATQNDNAVLEQRIDSLGESIGQMQPIVRVTDINRVNQQTVEVVSSTEL